MAEGGCLRDIAVDNLEVKGNLTSSTLTYKMPVVNITTATYTVGTEQSGTIFTLNRANGITVTLPAAEAGLVFEFHVGTTFTGTMTINNAADTDLLQGTVIMSDKDNLGIIATNAGDTTAIAKPAAADHQLVADNDTKGRFLGGHVVYKCITDALWLVSGTLIQDGAAATPFTGA